MQSNIHTHSLKNVIDNILILFMSYIHIVNFFQAVVKFGIEL